MYRGFQQEAVMRSFHAIAIAAITLTGFGVKLFFFTPSAEVHGGGVDISRLHENKNLPAQQLDDMSFVFSTAD
jgi:hypothetical protein